MPSRAIAMAVEALVRFVGTGIKVWFTSERTTPSKPHLHRKVWNRANLVWLCTDLTGYGVYRIKHEYAEA
jgi:uncharacterized membrane protein YozB (DUF420 family)